MIGTVFRSYHILGRLGAGAMGEVFLAEHARLGRRVALKLLHPVLSANTAAVERLFTEARATASLSHPGIVEVYDCDLNSDGRAYLALEHLEGETLATRLGRGRLAPDYPLVAAIGAQVAEALSAAHARGIVHRDIKPANIFLVPDPARPGGVAVKLVDFGTAKFIDDSLAHAGPESRAGEIVGTPLYMSPEQCRGRGPVGAAADVYSLGCVLFESICGRPPFSGDGLGIMIEAHLTEAVPDPKALTPDLPEALRLLVLAMLEKSPAARPESAAEVARRLAALAAGDGAARRATVPRRGKTLRRSLWASVAVGSLAAVAAVWLVRDRAGTVAREAAPVPVVVPPASDLTARAPSPPITEAAVVPAPSRPDVAPPADPGAREPAPTRQRNTRARTPRESRYPPVDD
jgi:serine/threonine-protein kinase